MSTELFRKSALATLSSPEKLDQLMKITPPRSWIALSALALVLVVAILWSVFGSLPTTVVGNGIIMRKGGTFNTVAPSSGTVSDLQNFDIGEKIKKGQIIGHLSQPLLEQQIKAAKDSLQEEKMVSTEEGERQLKVLKTKEEQLQFLTTTEQQQVGLLRDGLITRQRHEETRQAIYATQNDIATARIALQELPVQQTKTNSPGGDRVSLRVAQAANRLNDLQLQYQLASNIVSPLDGRVVETMAMNGDVVREGQPILSIEISKKDLNAIIYLPSSSNAKLVMPGMTAQISPSTNKKERYGYLIGKVLSISKYPATNDGMMDVFHNADLVRDLTKDGPVNAVLVQLIPDHQTKSGYAWSSTAGAGVEVTSGTLCSGSFVVANKRPISLVIPMLKETVGL